MKRQARTTLVLVASVLALGCGPAEEPETASAPAPAAAPVVPVPDALQPRDVAVLDVAGHGEIRVELLPELAPKSVESFVALAESELYDGTRFHRVIPGFMVQGGDPNSKDDDPSDDGQGGPGYTLPDEFSQVSMVRGIVAMARPPQPDSAGSQFFIVHEDSRHLDGQYTVIGHVTQGIDVVDSITRVSVDTTGEAGPKDRPREDVFLRAVRIERGADSTDDDAPAPPPANAREWDEGSA